VGKRVRDTTYQQHFKHIMEKRVPRIVGCGLQMITMNI